MQFRALDLETNSVDVEKAEVAQVAFDTAPADVDGLPELSKCATSMVYCAVSSMPAGAARVNGLSLRMLKGKPVFSRKVRAVVKAVTEPGTVLVTFNGARYDLPIVARYAANSKSLRPLVEDSYAEPSEWHDAGGLFPRSRHAEGATVRERFELLFERQHVDVARLWQVVRKREVRAPWEEKHAVRGGALHSGMFAGSLIASHGYYHGNGFDDAHDASADNRGALAVLRCILALEHFTLAQALHFTANPLPGEVDFAGRFVWEGDQAITRFGPQSGTPIEDTDKGFLKWMLEKDFHRDTQRVVREFLAGRYPERKYEDE